MRTLYIGGQKNRKSAGVNWKTYLFLFLFLVISGSVLKITAPLIVENWINEKGTDATGYAFSVRKVDFSLEKGQVFLKDVKVYNPRTHTDLLESPDMTIHLNWSNFFLSQNKKVLISADKVDLFLSKDFSSEMKRIKAEGKQKTDLYLSVVEGKIGKLNIIEKKKDQSRTVLELKEINVTVKEVSLLSINKKTEFSFSSNIADGGKLNLIGKTREESGKIPWIIQGSLKQVPAGIFNKIAGDKLPFSFNESLLDAKINAYSEQGVVSGEITPEVKRLNLLVERSGVPTRSIARALTDELTFTLPFTLKDSFSLQYEDTYKKLRAYRKYPAAVERSGNTKTQVSQNEKNSKSDSFWSF